MSDEKVYDLLDDKKCDIKDDTPCKMKTALGMAADMSGFQDIEAVQFTTPGLQRILVEGKATKTQMVEALEEWAPSVPEERREEAQWLVEIVKEAGIRGEAGPGVA